MCVVRENADTQTNQACNPTTSMVETVHTSSHLLANHKSIAIGILCSTHCSAEVQRALLIIHHLRCHNINGELRMIHRSTTLTLPGISAFKRCCFRSCSNIRRYRNRLQHSPVMQLPSNKDASLKHYGDSMVILLQQEVNNLTHMMNSTFASENDDHDSIHTSDFPYEEQQHSFPQMLRFASIMAILAGISDALCLHRFNCYVTMMTGNTIVMSISLSEKRWKHALWRASLIGSYLLGAVCIQSIELTSLKWAVPIVTGIFSIADYLLTFHPERWQSHAVPILALGYGMIYGYAYQELDRNSVDVINGHIIMLGSMISDYLLGRLPVDVEQMALSSCVLVSLVMGCIVGCRLSCVLKPTSFPYFACLGISYAAVFTVYLS